MNKKQEPNKHKSIKEINTTKKYNGESSPYWDFIARKGSHGEDGELVEHTLANPDNLSSDNNLYDRAMSEEGELRLRIIKETMDSLSPQQQKVLRLCGFEGLTMKAAANQLGIKLATVQVLLQRAREKIKQKYDREKKRHNLDEYPGRE